ncbi:hypothetical protein Ga0100231_017425 [Opitutaceae bacterium TAV4]|uniref:hypothetical protein n=1 Tax=Geminisphaera colitermitum TaxID=1148786 RepID=UPI000158DD1B|nr:hypothetical protein [Geminisphaera colitermitum]RRJ95789.1 hypothetical protein Ga0100231_017425 [Opitutaceae bacterium TAV4]RRJ99214.1 hypothetical protein Ga0100230_013425 [Opitutaceae bacterium TAV3]
MFDRLQQLRRQKTILEEHLAWLDHEIAEAEGDSPPATIPTISTLPSAPGTTTTHTHHATLGEPEAPATTKAMARAEEIITQHKIAQASAPDDIRRGCLLLVVLGFTLLAIAFLLLWQFGPRQ